MAATVVLARKYRPPNFDAMVGQDATVKALSNALTQQRLHHAYLFTGTRGIGKTTVSRIFAKCLNCTGRDGQGGVTAAPCGTCEACTQIDEDRFIDYIELDAASNRGIAEVRDLLDRAAYKPSIGRYKVFMIDEAHQLTKESFNALLKTLEEPPEYVKFILATTDPQKMPPTVLSRCLQFNLRPMAPQTVREHLTKVLADEGIAFDEPALNLLARAARGSMRDALSLTDQAIAYGGGKLEGDAVRAMLGSVGREPVLALIDALARRDGRAVVTLCNELRAQGASPEGALDAMAVALQEMAVEQAVPGSLDASLPDIDTVHGLAAAMPADDTQLLYSIAIHGRDELALAPDPHAGLTMVLLRMLAFPGAGPGEASSRKDTPREGRARVPSSAPANVVAPVPTVYAQPTQVAVVEDDRASSSRARAAVEAREPSPVRAAQGIERAMGAPSGSSPGPAADPLRTPASDPAPAVARVADATDPHADPALADRWADVVARLNERQLISAIVRELAMQGSLLALDESASPPRWTLVVERESLRTNAAAADKLSAALAQLLGQPQQLDVRAGRAVDTPAQRETAERERRAREAERVVREDPLVQEMLSQFATARIVPGSIKYVN